MTLHVSIDGLRPDAVTPETAPFLDRLLAEGRSSREARTVMPSVTLPCHTSMVRSVPPTRHGVTSNTFTPLARPVPSIADQAKAHGRRTGMFHNWSELRDLADPASLDVVMMNSHNRAHEDDHRVTDYCLAALATEGLDYAFLYLGHVDSAGHAHGWMSDAYLAAVTNADACVRRAVEGALDPDLRVLWLSDHGGHDRGHGTDCDEDMTIPFCVWWPGVAAARLEGVQILDAAPTLAAMLGVPGHEDWEGTDRSS